MRGARPGSYWVNHTSDTWYQRASTLRAPCHQCLRLHTTIWPAPMGRLHPRCECDDLAIPPGTAAPLPACDPGAVMAALTRTEQAKILGADVAALVRAGLVPIRETVRDDWTLVGLAALARRLRLGYDRLVRSGVDATAAREAVDGGAGGG